jgi:O-acetyl-ADP-ribose deacetylase (regulator of RNase III)
MTNIQVKFGNLITEESIFIVNASNTELTLGSGVSMAFRKYCSNKYNYQEMLKTLKLHNEPIIQGDVIVSNSGGASNFKYALHAAVMNYTDNTKDKNPTYEHIHTSLENIKKIVINISIRDNINRPKLVVPLLGCGVGGLNKAKVFKMICNIFHNIGTGLTLVIYINDPKDYEWIMEYVRSEK